jgi:hypothetical protein
MRQLSLLDDASSAGPFDWVASRQMNWFRIKSVLPAKRNELKIGPDPIEQMHCGQRH